MLWVVYGLGKGVCDIVCFFILILVGNVVKDNLFIYWKSGLFMVRLFWFLSKLKLLIFYKVEYCVFNLSLNVMCGYIDNNNVICV